ncbi:GerAB/ArcD/ProY family transporter [Natroniella acetigena]|uniref:YkvI family membrane protein n=1 Tax=Natroniella acetigena TaxID=52004 RepID=UPI00200B2B70|nr:GerAB/ArcD/ProY family transporter [Natroniella acetigena]MCK8826851.1 GerAB/ArcD/ProY family transporter [Natroniella acetigena]
MKLGVTMKITVTYIGAVIGAGFASGQEIFQFFIIYRNNGLLGIILAGIIFSILGVNIVYIGKNLSVANYQQLFYRLAGKKLGCVADFFFSLFLFGSLVVMLAGSKEIVAFLFSINSNIALLVSIVIVVLANYYGLEGIMKLNLVLIPFLIIVTLLVINGLVTGFEIDLTTVDFELEWIFSSLVYSGYNLILGLTVLLPLADKAEKRELTLGVIAGGLLLGLLAFLIGYVLNQFYPQVLNTEIPMLEIISQHRKDLYHIYAVTLWLAMLTTASCNLYGLLDRIESTVKLTRQKILIILMVLIGPISNLSFARLIEWIYPQLGKASLGLLSLLIINYLCQDRF